jgi:hypothetical protein
LLAVKQNRCPHVTSSLWDKQWPKYCSAMIDSHNRECPINQGWLITTQVIILLSFTETTPGKHLEQIEILYKNAKLSIFSPNYQSSLHFLSQQRYRECFISWYSISFMTRNSILVSINMTYSTHIIRCDILHVRVIIHWFHSLETLYSLQTWFCHV